MSSKGDSQEVSGEGTITASSSENISSSASSESGEITMKRVAAKQRIERYYFQLTDGCGRSECHNCNCASSSCFQFTSLNKSEAAAKALELFKQKANLCDSSTTPYKVPKNGDGSSHKPSSHASGSSSKAGESSGVSGSGTTVQGSSVKADSAVAGSSSMDVTSSGGGQTSSASGNSQPKIEEVTSVTEDSLMTIFKECESSSSWAQLIRTLGSVFSNPDSLKHSFLRSQSKEDIRSMEVDMDKDTDEKDTSQTDRMEGVESCGEAEDVDSISPESLNASLHGHVRLKEDEVSVDIDSLSRTFTKLFAITESPFQSALTNALRSVAKSVEMDLRYHQAYDRDPNILNIFIIIFEILVLDTKGDLESCTPHILRAAGLLPTSAQAKLAKVWAKYPYNKLKQLLGFLHQVITLRILSAQWSTYTFHDDDGITGAAKVMKVIFYASIIGGQMDPSELLERENIANREIEESLHELLGGAVGGEKDRTEPKEDPLGKELRVDPLDCRKPLIPWEDFVNDLISDGIRMEKDYAHYKNDSETKFSFLSHSFLLTTAMKNLGMYYDSKIRMVNERRVSLLQSLVNGVPTMPYLRIRIRRDHIIDDALVNLEMIAMDNPQDLKKQLYVEFEGEQGIDEGGVSKEFFQLVVEEIFNPDIGMFVYDEETRNFWFNSTSFENDQQFILIGIVIGLAIYNNVILDVRFPMVVYRKLMGKLGTFSDLKDSHPTLAKGLENMLTFEGDLEETFMQTFCISYTDVFGTSISHNLKEGGEKIPVTNENKAEYVDMYAHFLLNKSIEKPFRAFKRGFHAVTDESPIKVLFQPEEVELLVCGNKHFDFRALEEATDYDGGFTQQSTVIRYFWEVAYDFSEEQQRKLLQFTTGSDRVPVGGLSKLKLVIARHGPDSDRLPTAHTCFNVLLLPEYSTKEKLQERLTKAINYAKGFGML